MTKISGFIISIILVGFFAGIFSIFMSGMVSEYDVSGYNDSDFDSFNKLAEINNITDETQSALEKNPPDSVLDVLGAFFSNGYDALQITFKSFNVFNSMTNDALDLADIGPAGVLLRNVLTAIVIISLLFAIIYAITKVPL